jgi:WD40 repeat protein
MVWSVAFDPTGRMLVAGSGDFHSSNDTMQIWRVDDGTLLRAYTLSGYMGVVSSVAFDADEQTLLSGESNTVRMWHLDSEEPIHTFVRNLPTIDSLAFALGGKTFASSHTVARKGAVLGGEIRLWRRSDSALLGTFSVQTNPVWSLAFAPDGVLLASGSDDTTVQVWHTKAIKHMHTLRGHTAGIRGVAFSPDGTLLASGALDRTVRLWRVADGTPLGTLRGPNVRIRSVAFSPDGTLLACGGQDGTIQLWHVADQELLGTLHGHTAKINSLAFAPGSALLASGADDGTVRLWGIVKNN